MDETDYMPQDRCIRNERKIDNLELKIDALNDKSMKLDYKVDKIITNDLKHTPSYDEVPSNKQFRRSNIETRLALIASASSIIVAILTNLDKITEFIKSILGGI